MLKKILAGLGVFAVFAMAGIVYAVQQGHGGDEFVVNDLNVTGGITSLNGEIVSPDAENTVHVRTAADLPTPAAGIITLTADTKYIFDNSLTLSDRLVIPTGSTTSLTSSFIDGNVLTYSGTGTFITGSSIDLLTITDFTIINSSGSGTLFSINGSATATFENIRCLYTGFASLGAVDNVNFGVLQQIIVVDNDTGISFDEVGTILLDGVTYENSTDTGGVLVSVSGDATASAVNISNVLFNMQSTEALIDIDSAINSGTRVNILNNTGAGGTFFETGSLEEDDVKMNVRDNSTQKDSRNIGSWELDDSTAETSIALADTWYNLDLDNGAVAADNIERWSLTNTDTGELTYLGLEDFSGVLIAHISAQSAGATQEFWWRAIVNGTTPIGIPVARSTAGATGAMPLIVPVTVSTNDTVRLQVLNNDGTSNIVHRFISVNIQ